MGMCFGGCDGEDCGISIGGWENLGVLEGLEAVCRVGDGDWFGELGVGGLELDWGNLVVSGSGSGSGSEMSDGSRRLNRYLIHC